MSEEKDKIIAKLFNVEAKQDYGNEDIYHEHLLEQYKVYVEGADRISARRQSVNSFFVTINTALIALVSYMHLGSKSDNKFYWLIALAGIVISYMWYRLLRSYRDLNTAKFKVIHEIEKKLPLSPYDAEWEAVGRGENSRLYLQFTHIEVGIPWVFLVLHIVAFIRSFPWELFQT